MKYIIPLALRRFLFLTLFLVALAMTDSFSQRIYWTEGNNIRSSNLDGSLIQTHYSNAEGPEKLSIDHGNNIAFFLTRSAGGKTYRINLSTFTSPTLIYDYPAMTDAYNLAHHNGDNTIYMTAFVDSDPGRIEYSNYTDQDCCQFPTNLNLGGYNDYEIFHDIGIDTDNERVYVSHQTLGKIYYTGTFGGALTEIVASGSGEAFDLNLGSREVIYEVPGSNQIRSADMDTGTGTTTLISGGLTDVKAIAVHKSDGRIIILDGNTIKTARSDGTSLFQILGGLSSPMDLSISQCSYPATQASSASATSTTPTSIDLSWNNGSGNQTLVIARASEAVSAMPVDGVLHPANAVFSTGDDLGGGNYVVYRGTGSSVTVGNLLPSTTYHFAIYSLNDFGACYKPVAHTTSATTLPPPSPQSVTSSNPDGSYGVGSTVTVQVTFDQAVDVTGPARIQLETGATDRYASFISGSGTTTLSFTYTVQAGDQASDLDYVASSSLELNGGTIHAVDNTAATLTLPAPGAAGSLGANKNIVVDGNRPLITSVTPSLTPITDADAGTSTFSLTVVFGEAMNTSVNPTIAFPIEDPSSTLTLNNGSWLNSTTYVESYNVLDANENIPNIDIAVGSGQDLAGNTMVVSNQADIFSVNMCTLPVISVQPIDKTTCSNVSTDFAVTATGTTLTYQWFKDDGAGGPFNAISDGSQFTNTTTNQLTINNPTGLNGHRFRCEVVESGNCPVASAIVTLSVDPLPSTSNAGSPDGTCGISYTLTGNAPAIGTGTWSVMSAPAGSNGVSFSDLNSPNAVASLNTPYTYGAYTFQWEITSGVCTSNASTVQIVFSEEATSNAGTDFAICGNSDFAVSGTIGGAATSGHWQVQSGAGTFLSTNSATGSSISAPTITDTYQLGPGDNSDGNTIILELVAEDPDGAGPCLSVVSTVSIDVVGPPQVAPATASVCSNNTTGITLSAAPGTIASYEIKAIRIAPGLTPNSGNSTVGGGYTSNAILNDSYTNSTTSPLTVEYDVTAVGSTLSCEGPIETIVVTVNPLPQMFTLSGGGGVCSGEAAPVNLSGSQSGFNYVLLRDGSTTVQTLPGTGSALSFTPQTTAGNYTVEAVHSVTNCSLVMTGSVTVNVNTPPTSASLSGSTAICAGSSAQLTLNISGGIAPYTVDIENVGIITHTGSPVTVSPAATTSYVINSVVDANSCSAVSINSTPVTIQVDQTPTPAQAGTDAEVCDSQFNNLGGNTPAVGTGQWTLISGSGTITDAGNPQTGVTNLQFGANTFQWTISNGSCTSSSATITITRTPLPSGVGIVAASTGSSRFCQNEQAITFSVSSIIDADSYIWSLPAGFEPVSGSAETTEPSIAVNLINAQSGPIEVIGKNICGSSSVSNAFNVTVLPTPNADIVTTGEIVSMRTTSFEIESTSDISGIVWDFGDGETSSERNPSHIYQEPGPYVVTLEVSNSDGCIGTAQTNITVNGLEPISMNDIKNAITPNGDGANDVLYIENIENFPNNVVTILDRWGVEVIKLEGYKNDWDLNIQGSIIPAGNYLCIVQIQEGDNPESKVVTRTITVVKGKSE